MWVLAVNIATGSITLLGISAGAAVALGWGAVRVESGELSLSTLLVVLLLGVEVFRPLRDLVQLFHSSMLAVAATRGIYQLLDAVPEVQPPPSLAATPTVTLRPVLRFEHVTFGYLGGRRPARRSAARTRRRPTRPIVISFRAAPSVGSCKPSALTTERSSPSFSSVPPCARTKAK